MNQVGNIPGLEHRTVNHSLFFVDLASTPKRSSHTEIAWRRSSRQWKVFVGIYAAWISRWIYVEGESGSGQVGCHTSQDIHAVSGVTILYTFKTAPLGATTSDESHDHQTIIIKRHKFYFTHTKISLKKFKKIYKNYNSFNTKNIGCDTKERRKKKQLFLVTFISKLKIGKVKNWGVLFFTRM